MNKLHIYIGVAISLCLAACDMFNTFPEGDIKTSDQKSEAFSSNSSTSSADINGIYAQMIALFAGLGEDASNHNDFGLAAQLIALESNGQDFIAPNIGYNWFSYDYDFKDRDYTSSDALQMWSVFYKIIFAANNALQSLDPELISGEVMYNYGQARAARAFAYLNMAQIYQFTYSEQNKTLPCVPVITEHTSTEQQLANPRASLDSVYSLILSDLSTAITALDGYNRADKGHINQAVAYGLRARANLAMKNYAAAASDAEQCLTLSGATPYTLVEVSKPNFCSADANSVIWANLISESNDIVKSSIVNWSSHLSTFYTDGYTGVGATRSIPKALYAKIPNGDVRKGWWLNANGESALLNNANYQSYKSSFSAANAYTNVKFGVRDDNTSTLSAAADWLLMRAEEMLLIQAEGLAMSGNTAEGKAVLEQFVQNYRYAGYTCRANSPEELQDEIWLQRRIELWGEGFAFFDFMRLQKPLVREKGEGAGYYPVAWQYTIPANSPILLWMIPQSEIEANDGISEADNNPKAASPAA